MMLSRLAQSRSLLLAALAAVVFSAVLAGCNFKSGGFVITRPAHLRIFNALVDGGPLNVVVDDDNALVTGLPFEGLTTYLDVDAGTREIQVSAAGGASPIADSSTLFTDDSSYTYLVYGTSAAPIAQLIPDATVTTTQPNSGEFALRVTNAAAGSGGFDVYVTQPNMPLDNASPNVGNVTYTTTTSPATFISGSFQVRLTLPNSKVVIYDGGTITFNDRTQYWLVGYSKGSSALVNVALLAVDDVGSGTIANSKLAQFKVAHAAPGTSSINALVDGNVALANIPYLSASGYEGLPSGTHTVSIEAMTSPGAPIASVNNAFSPATDTTIAVLGTPGAQTAVAFSDRNIPGPSGSARVRFVNVGSDLGAVDVLVNFVPRATALANSAASGYVELPEDTYTINFDIAGTTNVVLSVPGVSVLAGNTYTLYLSGTAGQYAGILSRDD